MEAKSQNFQALRPAVQPATRPRVYVQTWGCQMNEYDSAKMAEVLGHSHGAERAASPEEADILLLNTCSVREKAQEKLFSQLGRWRPLKEARPDLIIGVGGCVASQEGAAILERAPFVDLVFGPQTLHRLPALLEQTRASRRPALDISFPEIEKFDHLPAPRKEGPTAFVSVMEGCSKYCSFCIVPYTRGEEVSRPLVDVLTEITQLAQQGVREVTLLGQNVNAYRGRLPEAETLADFALLLEAVSGIEGIERIRYTTSHPLEFTDALIRAHAELPKLAPQLHLPVQSGSDRILGMMKRGHTRAQYLERIRRLRERCPGISISTDFIVGFPTETEADFQASLDLVEEVRFDLAYSFLYSPRPGTPAALLVDSVTQAEKEQRLQRLQARITELHRGYSAAMVGSIQQVLVERPATKHASQLTGRCGNNRWVNFEVPPARQPALIGQFAEVEITEALPNSLRGRLHGTGS